MNRSSLFTFICALMLLTLGAQGQSEEAKSILESTISTMKSADGFQGDFVMKMYFGHDLEAEENGSIATSGDQIMMDLGQFKYIADGTSSWTYLKERNEVQINDVSEDDFSMYNPLMLLDHFFEGGFAYEIMDKYEAGDDELVKLDFKPEDRDSEYAKISVVLSESKNLPVAFNLIQKDGVRYEIEINSISTDKVDDASLFKFNKEEYPEIIVEDLRLGE